MVRTLATIVLLLISSAWAQSYPAPQFSADAVWIDNGSKAPHSIKGYRGHVLLVDFWEYTCINCIRDFATVKRWYQKYHPYGFDVVAVHYGEFPMGFSVKNVRDAAQRFGFPWPVLADVRGSTWKAFQCDAWPTRYLIDPSGNIVMKLIGEGDDAAMEDEIRTLLTAAHPEIKDVAAAATENPFAPQCGVPTPEMYVGDWLAEGKGMVENPEGYRDGSVIDYRSTPTPDDGRVVLAGKWRTDADGVTSANKKSTATLRYHARSVYAVLSIPNPKKPVRLDLLQDGKPLAKNEAGVDVKFDAQGAYVDVTDPRMYYLVVNPAFGSHTVVLQPRERGLDLHSFTFGNDCQQNFAQK